MTRYVTLAVSLLVLGSAPAAAQAQKPVEQKPVPPLARWIDFQNATLNTRYRFVDNSAGVATTNQLQHRESLRARFKFDAPGRYALNLGLFTGSRFTCGWNNTGIRMGDWQGSLTLWNVFVVAKRDA